MPQPYDERRYQVFVSSTFRDLQEERQKVLQAVLEMKAFPAGMEMFPSADDEQWQFIQQEIESSDYYIVIVGGKYGSLAPDGRSFTEKEYDYAIELRKPVMGFLFHDLGDLKGSQLEDQADKKEKLLRFRDKVQGGKLVKFYRNSDELKSQVWHALIHAFQFRPQEGWMRAKNSRRIDDLEEITRLQKRVMELEAENTKLRNAARDARESLAQGGDPFQWKLKLKSLWNGQKNLPPPAAEFVLETNWNELLVASFARSMPRATWSDVERGLTELGRSKVREAFADASDWLELMADASEPFDSEIYNLMIRVRIQLLGLGYIDIDNSAGFGDKEVWVLTDKGRLQGALLEGVTRSAGQASQ